MATIATIDLPTTEFALYNKFVGIPAIRVEIEIDRPVTAENEQRSSSVRVSATDHRSEDEIERALATDLSVAALDRFAALDGEWLYRIAWAEATQASVRILTRRGGTILTAVGQHSTWTLRMLFPEREALARSYDYCTTRGLTFEVKRIYQVENGRENGSNGSIESADGVGVRVEIVGIFGHYSRNSCEDSETASKSRDDARSIRKRGLFRPRFRHRRRNEKRELLRGPAIRLFTVILP